ncbi:MAG: hypothetical protein HYR56_30080 [Acidobacteria bacterium]|nr:hypothetical protein [Acidobacteriota bacterium]MBI3428185.1 hypothetical protein [Acidobacteriota bacterium]
MSKKVHNFATWVCLLALGAFALALFTQNKTFAQERSGTSARAAQDRSSAPAREVATTPQSAKARSARQARPRNETEAFARRGDISHLPPLLKARLIELAARPHTFEPTTAFAEAADPSQLFQYYLLDTNHFQPNVFTSVVPGLNDTAIPTAANAANGGLPTLGSVRVVIEPKAGLPTDPNDPGAFIDVFMDFSGLFVINNEAGWYEGWMISDLRVPRVAPPRADGTAQFGTLTQADYDAIAARGRGNNRVVGNIFTADGNAPRLGSVNDVFPDPARQPNTVPHPVSMGAFNALQQSDVHAYWEFNAGTNWVFPHYELPFTGGVPGTFAAGLQYGLQSVIPGSGPAGVVNNKLIYGDNPDNPRDPDRTEATNPAQRESRNRFIPSALDQEVLLNAFLRVKSFKPDVTDVGMRLFMSYAQEIARVDQNGDGVISFQEADINGFSDGGQSNRRLYLPPSAFNRFAVTREINDGLLAPRFAPFQRAYVLSGSLTLVRPSVPASVPRDADDR